MKVEIAVSIGLVGCVRRRVIEVEDDASDNDIWEEVEEIALANMVEIDWKRVSEPSK